MESSQFMDRVRGVIRVRQLAYATEKAYCYWIRYFVRFSRYRSAQQIIPKDVTRFLTFLAVDKNVSPNTQNQALNALAFLFRHVLEKKLENIKAVRAKDHQRIPVVLNTSEVLTILSDMKAPYTTMIELA